MSAISQFSNHRNMSYTFTISPSVLQTVVEHYDRFFGVLDEFASILDTYNQIRNAAVGESADVQNVIAEKRAIITGLPIDLADYESTA